MKITGFEKGIEDILREEGAAEAKLPDHCAFIPCETVVESRLDGILHAPSLEEYILASLAPRLVHKECLIPARFRHLLGEIASEVASLAEKAETAGDRQALEAMARLLAEEKELTGLLNAYRRLLIAV